MSNLILIRHSITKQQPDVDSHLWQLTAEGRSRCQNLAEQLQPYNIDRIFTSEEAKTILTGQLVANVLKIPCESASDLQEQSRSTAPYFADVQVFRAKIRAAMAEPDKLLFGEESFTDALQRFTQQIDSLLKQYPDDTLAIVTHGTVLALYLAHLSGQNAYVLWESLSMPTYVVISLPHKTVEKIVTGFADREL